jgi:hypothetical protein
LGSDSQVKKHEAKPFHGVQLGTFIDAARAQGVYGFVLALSWADVDFVNRPMRVSKSLEQQGSVCA